jgi:hypothetical protein
MKNFCSFCEIEAKWPRNGVPENSELIFKYPDWIYQNGLKSASGPKAITLRRV